jgi:hypothetical protein
MSWGCMYYASVLLTAVRARCASVRRVTLLLRLYQIVPALTKGYLCAALYQQQPGATAIYIQGTAELGQVVYTHCI